MLQIYRSINEALRDGWSEYDRWSGGIVLTRRRNNGPTEVALFEPVAQPLPTGSEVRTQMRDELK